MKYIMKRKSIIKVGCFGAVVVATLAVAFAFTPNKSAKAAQLNINDYGGTIEKEEQEPEIKDIRECDITITDGVVKVVANGKELKKDKDYWVNVLEQKFLIQSIAGVDGNLNTYDVVTYYTISGKGEYVGTVNKTLNSKKTLYER